MGQLSGQRIFNALRGLFSGLDTSDAALLSGAFTRKKVQATVTDGGTAGTAQTETVVWQNDTGYSVKLIAANVMAPIAVTANGSNYATFTAYQRTSAGASQTAMAALDTTTGSLTAFAPAAMVLTAANVVVPSGSVVTFAVTKTGTGVALAAATSQVRIELQFEPA